MAIMDYLNTNQNISQHFVGLPVGSELSVMDKIILVGAKDAPMLREINTTPVTSVKHVWTTDKIRKARDANTSAKPYYSLLNNSAELTEQEHFNSVQYFVDDIVVTHVLQATKQHSGETVMDKQRAKKSIEHTRDIEAALWSDTIPTLLVSLDPTNPANKVGGIWNYVPEDHEFDYRGASGNDRKDIVVDDLLNLQQKVFDAGGDPNKIFVGSALKRKISELIKAKQLSKFSNTPASLAELNITQIETDFGLTDIVLSRYFSELGIEDRMICADPSTIELGNLIETDIAPVPTTATAEAERIHTACTFIYNNPWAFAAAYGLK